jgi:predicted ABC-type ATPase
MKTRGYAIRIYFLWVPEVGILLDRIKDRVASGGHDVPQALVRRRFARSIKNFLQTYSVMADFWIIFDNSKKPPSGIALEEHGDLRIVNQRRFENIISTYGPR